MFQLLKNEYDTEHQGKIYRTLFRVINNKDVKLFVFEIPTIDFYTFIGIKRLNRLLSEMRKVLLDNKCVSFCYLIGSF